MAEAPNVVLIGKKPIDNYVLSAIVLFNQGEDEVVIKARGDNISKAVDVYNALKDRLGDGVELVDVEIGSEHSRGRLVSFIKIRIKRSL